MCKFSWFLSFSCLYFVDESEKKKNDQPKLFLFRLIEFWSTCPAELIF